MKKPDQRSFILGMITAFCECVAAGCKDLALSPPLSHEVYEAIHEEAEQLIERHGLISLHEENLDLPEKNRFEWILIASQEEIFRKYRDLRSRGLSPAQSLKPFSELLSYNAEKSVSTGYDAYRELFDV